MNQQWIYENQPKSLSIALVFNSLFWDGGSIPNGNRTEAFIAGSLQDIEYQENRVVVQKTFYNAGIPLMN